MKLISLQIRNFKGLQSYDVALNGADLEVFGVNGAGKTTIADAYYWLLFGKNLNGATDFDIFPKGAPDGTEPSVFGEFEDKNSRHFTLQRVIKKNFVRKRGEATAEYKGNTREYYIDGVPKKESEMKAFINSLGSEEEIRILADPKFFAGGMKWQDRRKILLKTFGEGMSEADVINRHEELFLLKNHIGAMYTVQDVADMKKAERRRINDRLKQIPGRIDERVRSRPEVPEAKTTATTASLAKKHINLLGKIDSIKNGRDVSEAKTAVLKLEMLLTSAEMDYSKNANSSNRNLEGQSAVLRKQVMNCKERIDELTRTINSYNRQIAFMQDETQELRVLYSQKKAEVFEGENCPTCNRPYEPEQVDEAKASFNLSKARKLGDINTKGKEIKELKESLEATLKSFECELGTEKERLPLIQSDLSQLQASMVNPAPFGTTAKYKELSEQIKTAKAELARAEQGGQATIAKYQQELAEVDNQMEINQRAAAAEEMNKQNELRIEELKAEEKKLGDELAAIDQIIDLCDKFTQLQADDYEAEINSHFDITKWKLFDRQINGSIAPNCEPTYQGIAFNDTLNEGAKINVGLDIINAFAKKIGESWPIVIDGAESITNWQATESQMLRFTVSPTDLKLRTETSNRGRNNE